MKLLRKTLAALLVLVILLGLVPAGVVTGASGAYTAYTDVSGHWAAGAINRVNSMGFIDSGIFPGNRFYPDWYITRAEFFSLVVNALGATATANVSGYSDLEPNTWQLDIVSKASRVGLANGYPDGTMRPNDNILRQEAATLVARTLGMTSEAEWNLSRFYDSAFISEYARTYVSAFVDRGLLTGYPDGNFRPGAFITRAEAVVIIDRIFNNVFMPETGFRNVYLQGGLLIQTPGAELRDAVVDGDVTIGDGVGSGSVYITNTTINGRLIVRGGGPNSVVLSNATVTEGIYVASFVADTRISVTDNSNVPLIEAVSGFTLAGSGVPEITILENAREDAVVNLTGVNLNDLIVNGPGSQIRLNSGHIINLRVNDGGQGMSLNLAANTSVGHLTVSAPNVAVTGTGSIRNLIINHSGASVAQEPELLTLGVNVIATVAGKSVSSTESQWSNNIDRSSGDSPLKVELLTNTSALAPFDQATLRLNMVAGRTSSEVHISQSAASRVPLTQRGSRYGFWIGYFIPAPAEAGSMASITYSLVDGEPITLPPRTLDTYQGRRGLLIYLPVFREQGREVGLVREVLYINWGAHLTENIQFVSSTIHLTTLNPTQTANLQRDFDNRIMYSIQQGASPYTGAEATRRILNSDNPLGLPSTNNKGLDAMNRAVTSGEARSILEDLSFATELGVATTGNSQYSALSDAGKQYVAEQVLAARRTTFATASAVKAAFDRAVQARLNAETTLLGQINASISYAALRTIIENSANAAILQFQTGADPYKSYTASQKDAMADYLWRLRQYRSIQEVIDAIQRYLNDPANAPGGGSGSTDIRDLSIRRIAIAVSPTGTTFSFLQTRSITLSVELTDGSMLTPAQIGALISNGDITIRWDSTGSGPLPLKGNVGELSQGATPNAFSLLCTNRGDVASTRTDRLTFTLIDSTGKSFTATSTFTVAPYVAATGITRIVPELVSMIVGDMLQLQAVLTPSNATETAKWFSNNGAIASVDEATGLVTAISAGVTTITAHIDAGGAAGVKTVQVRVFRSANDVITDPNKVTLMPGGTTMITAYTATPGRQLLWTYDKFTDDLLTDAVIATVNNNGRIEIPASVRTILLTPDPADPSALKYPNGITVNVYATVVGSNPDANGGIGRAVIEVTVKLTDGISIAVRNSVMNSSGTAANRRQNIELTIDDPDMIAQKFYVQVQAELPGTNPARCLQAGQPVGEGDNITIEANPAGVGVVTVSLWTTPDLSGYPVGNALTIIVSPESVPVSKFDHNGTSGPSYDPNVRNPYATGPIENGSLGRVIEMKLTDTTTRVTPYTIQNAVEVAYTGVSWYAYECDSNREILYLIQTDAMGYILESGSGNRLADAAGADILWSDVFHPDIENPGAVPLLRGNFKPSGVPLELKQRIIRDGAVTRVPTTLMGVLDGNLRPNSGRLTGLLAVTVTPQRAITDNSLLEVWSNLYYGNVPVFRTDDLGVRRFNYTIARQSMFQLQKLNPAGEWIDSLDNIYDITPNDIYSNAAGGQYRILDVNGREIGASIASNVNAIVIGDPNASTNTFFVRLLPAAMQRPSLSGIPNPKYATWADPTAFTPPAFPGDEQRFDFVLGSEDPYREDPPVNVNNPLEYPYLHGRITQGAGTNNLVSRIYLVYIGAGNSSAYIATEFSPDMPTINVPIPYIFTIEQYSKLGFAPTGSDGYLDPSIRQRAERSDTGQPALEYNLIITPPASGVASIEIPTGIGVDLSIDSATIISAAAALGINLATASYLLNVGDSSPDAILTGSVLTLPSHPGIAKVLISGNGKALDVTVNSNSTPGFLPTSIEIPGGFSGFLGSIDSFAALENTIESILDADPGDVSYKSLTPGTLTIDDAGVATARSPGIAMIEARDGEDSVLAVVEVAPVAPPAVQPPDAAPPADPAPPAPPAMTALALRASAGVVVGRTMTLAPFVTPYNAEKSGLRWTSSDESIATVSNTGTVTGVKAGNVTIAVTDASGNIRAECAMAVRVDSRPVTSITMSKRTLALNAGATGVLTVTFRPTNATLRGVSWTSSDERVARVDPNGRVTGVSAGTAVITATSDSGARTATCTVTVVVPVESVTLPDASISLRVGQTYQINPTVNPSNATNPTARYATRSSSTASVSSAGLVTARRAGTTTITVTIGGKTVTLRVTVTR